MQFDENGSGQMTNANLSHRYLWGPAVDQLLSDEQIAPSSSGQGYNVSAPGTVVWPLTDNVGTVRDLAICDLTSGTTSVVNHLDYSSFGQLLSQTNPATGNTAAVDCLFGFTGRAFDPNTGLQNNLNRWYNASLGRWESPDPMGLGPDSNPYRYCGNGPTDGTDPSGLFEPVEWALAGGVFVGSTIGGYFLGRPVGTAVGTWWSTPRPVELAKQADGSTLVTVNEDYNIVILFGHGNATTPHKFKPMTATAVVGFVGCDANATNGTIPLPNRIPGLGPITGDLTNWQTSGVVDAWVLIRKNAIGVAAKLIHGGVKKVTIRGVLGYAGSDQTNWQMPRQWTDVITADNLTEKENEYAQ